MTRADMLTMLRVHLNDEQKVGWEFDIELVEYLDRACSFLSNTLIIMKHTSMIKQVSIDGPTELPADYVGFVGRQPIQIVGNMAIPYGRLDNTIGIARWDDPNIPKEPQGLAWRDPTSETVPTPSWAADTTNENFTVYYWARLPFVSEYLDIDILPYNHEFSGQILDIARMLALNKNEYDIAQDLNLQKQIMGALGAAIGADEQ